VVAAELSKISARLSEIARARLTPQTAEVADLRKFSRYDRVENNFQSGNLTRQRRSDPTDTFAQLGKMGERLALAIDFAAAIGPEVAAGDFQQRRFSLTVGPEDRPMLARLNQPIDGIEDFPTVGDVGNVAQLKRGSSFHR
jgi:hypothetical protein